MPMVDGREPLGSQTMNASGSLVLSLALFGSVAPLAAAQRRPDCPPPLARSCDVPQRYVVAEREVIARLESPPVVIHQPPPVTVVSHPAPVVVHHPAPQVVYAAPPAPVYVHPAPVYVHPAPIYVEPCRPVYRPHHSHYHGGSGVSFSFSYREGRGGHGYSHGYSHGYRHHGGHRRRGCD